MFNVILKGGFYLSFLVEFNSIRLMLVDLSELIYEFKYAEVSNRKM